MIKHPRRRGQSRATFLRNHADGIAAADLFVVPTIGFKLLYGLVILGHGRRRLIHYAVTAHPTSEWIARQIVEAFPWDQTPTYLVRDRDGVYGAVVKPRLRGLGIRDRPIAPASPWQNAYVERLIGSIRRDCIDHVIYLRRGASAPDHVALCRLLQPSPYASHPRKGRADQPSGAVVRPDHHRTHGRRSPSPLRSNLVFSMDRYGLAGAHAEWRATPQAKPPHSVGSLKHRPRTAGGISTLGGAAQYAFCPSGRRRGRRDYLVTPQ